MFGLRIIILSVVAAEGFRIRRSESEESKDAISDGNIEYKNSDLKNIKLAEDGLFNDDVSNMSQDLIEHEALYFIQN